MSEQFIISGTDTDVGKTVVAAMLTLALEAYYWKPIQSGIAGGVDTKTVQRLTMLPPERFLEERYILSEPLSPHRAAEIDGITIDPEALVVPQVRGPLVIEGAGGLMVPITRDFMQIELFKRWGLPVILVARTTLGTINHTLLSIEVLRTRGLKLHGIIFNGPDNADNIRTIAEFSGAKILGCVPVLDSLEPRRLTEAFEQHFRLKDFLV